MWEFGTLARNLLMGKGYSINVIDLQSSSVVTSAHMPPGLPFLFYGFFQVFGDNSTTWLLILLFNTILATCSVFVLFLIAERMYGYQVAVLSGIFAAFYPPLIFSAANFNSIIIYQLLLGLIFIYFLKIYERKYGENPYTKDTLLLAICFGSIYYFRAEMPLLMIVVAAILLFKRRIAASATVFVSLVIISPWTVRNYSTFGKFVPISTSMGLNFHIGHNYLTKGSGWLNGTNEIPPYFTPELGEKLKQLPLDTYLELDASAIAFQQGLDFTISNPETEVLNSFRKLFYLWVIDLNNPKSKSPLYFVPWFVLLLLFCWGCRLTYRIPGGRVKMIFPLVYLIFSTTLAVIFFSIPRYQVQMSYIMIPTAMYCLDTILRKLGILKTGL
jgi:4-amino-4-deoxy-L-arabinose transferase-like glycosyltransferase